MSASEPFIPVRTGTEKLWRDCGIRIRSNQKRVGLCVVYRL